jgi:hypothetical protein
LNRRTKSRHKVIGNKGSASVVKVWILRVHLLFETRFTELLLLLQGYLPLTSKGHFFTIHGLLLGIAHPILHNVSI